MVEIVDLVDEEDHQDPEEEVLDLDHGFPCTFNQSSRVIEPAVGVAP